MAKPTTLRSETEKNGEDGWFPEVLFQPQIQGPRNRSAEEDVVPTPYYDARTMPKFRANPAPGDVNPGWETNGSDYPSDVYSSDQPGNNPKTRFGGTVKPSQNPQKNRSK